MSCVSIRFNANSRSPNCDRACIISKSIGYSIDKENESFYIVSTNNINNKLIELYHLVEQLKGTTAKIDGKDVENLIQLEFIVNCQKKFFCKGECDFLGRWEKIFNLLEIKDHELNELYTEQLFDVEMHPDILLESSAEAFCIDTKYLEKDFTDFCSIYLENCSKFRKESYIKLLRSVPKKLRVKRTSFEDIRKKQEDSQENEGMKSMEKVVQLFGDEFELRLRKVLSEYIKKEKST